MPARTNDFQELVSCIRRSLAKPGDKIEDSVLVHAVGLEEDLREIDILHTTSAGVTRIRIAVEAKDESRRLGVQRIEEYYGKYTGEARVPVDKFVIVSRRGFTGPAKRKAKRLGIPLLTLQEAKALDWSKVAEEHSTVRKAKGFQLKLPPHIKSIETVPPLSHALKRKIICEGLLRGPRCKVTCTHGRLSQYVWQHFRTYSNIDDVMRQLCEAAKASPAGDAYFEIDLKAELTIRYDGVDYPVKALCVKVHAVDIEAPIKCISYEMTDTEGDPRLVHHLSAEAFGKGFQWAVTDGVKRGYPVRVGDPKPSEKKPPSK